MTGKAKSVGAFEAKTRLSELLERVSRGEEITITKHERPIARLVPVQGPSAGAVKEAFMQMEEILRRTRSRSDSSKKHSHRELIEEGRRR